MLKRTVLSMAMVGIAFATGYAAAQTYFRAQAPVETPVASSSKNIVTAENFQTQTQQQQDKKNQALDNQLKQELAKIPPPPPPPPPHEESTGNTAASAPPGQGSEPGQAPAADATPATAPTAKAPASQDLTPSGPAPAAPPVTAPNSTQVYTGFQNSNSGSAPAATPNPPPANSGGGWNIKY